MTGKPRPRATIRPCDCCGRDVLTEAKGVVLCRDCGGFGTDGNQVRWERIDYRDRKGKPK